MKINLVIHLEPVSEGLTWWAESPDIPGLSVLDDQLVNVLARADYAVREILIEQDADLSALEITYELVDNQVGLTREDAPSVHLDNAAPNATGAPPRPNPRVATTLVAA